SARQRTAALTAQLDSLSPLSVLGRGYSLTHRLEDGLLVRNAGELVEGDEIVTRFAHGRVVSRVQSIGE
ncbi:MAG: exodeoxyribonuclease VII large subunit, partial [Pirellulales bacterium]